MLKTVLENIFYSGYKFYRARKSHFEKRYNNQRILRGVKVVGKNVQINGEVHITYPKGLVIGNNVNIEDNSYLDSRAGIAIGSNTSISRNVSIISVNRYYENESLSGNLIPGRIVIEEGVYIGPNVSILPGVTIGKRATIEAGTIVEKDIPSPLRIGSDTQHNQNNINDIPVEPEIGENVYLGDNLIFVVSTGRAGSKSIGQLQHQFSNLYSFHESYYEILKVLSFDFLVGAIQEEELKTELRRLFNLFPYNVKGSFYLESDQKLVPFIRILHELFPKAHFIGLFRSPLSFVKSAASRGWFDHDYPIKVSQKVVLQPTKNSHGCRITADYLGEMETATWKALSQNEKLMWYWKYWNQLILDQFEFLDKERYSIVKLENFNAVLKLMEAVVNQKPSPDATIKKLNPVRRKDKQRYETFEIDPKEKEELMRLNTMYEAIQERI